MDERAQETDEHMRAYWTRYIDDEIEDFGMDLQEGAAWSIKQRARWMWLRERVEKSAKEKNNG